LKEKKKTRGGEKGRATLKERKETKNGEAIGENEGVV